jgi:protein TonB
VLKLRASLPWLISAGAHAGMLVLVAAYGPIEPPVSGGTPGELILLSTADSLTAPAQQRDGLAQPSRLPAVQRRPTLAKHSAGSGFSAQSLAPAQHGAPVRGPDRAVLEVPIEPVMTLPAAVPDRVMPVSSPRTETAAALTEVRPEWSEPASPSASPGAALPRVAMLTPELDRATAAPRADPGANPSSDPDPVVGAVAYLDTPAPTYPDELRRAGREGLVVLRVRISGLGRPDQLRVLHTSGSAGFDAAALGAVSHWRFAPARRGEQSIAAWMDIPVRFRLERDAREPH